MSAPGPTIRLAETCFDTYPARIALIVALDDLRHKDKTTGTLAGALPVEQKLNSLRRVTTNAMEAFKENRIDNDYCTPSAPRLGGGRALRRCGAGTFFIRAIRVIRG
jgi:hypothetical protein